MPKAILYRNDEQDRRKKAFFVYQNFEQALSRLARQDGREVRGNFSLDAYCRPRRGTAYASTNSIVSIGLTAHERLSDVVKTSLIYLEPQSCRPAESPDLTRLMACGGRGRPASKVGLLGRRAGQASAFLPRSEIRLHALPPVDLGSAPLREGDTPRLTIVNHLSDDRLARSITGRFLEGSRFFIECIGLAGEAHNRVRYLDDADASDVASSIHIHIGAEAEGGDRLRICDSWQSRVPVLYFNVAEGAAAPGWPAGLHNEHNVLACNTYGEACAFLSLLLETPNLHRIITDNGRAAAAPAARSWDALVRDLVA